MDFQEFPKDKHGYDNVLVVVDRLGKHPISIPCYKEVTAEETAHLFIKHVYQYKGPPDTIVSDRGPQFISHFWKEFCRILRIKLKLSTAHHPQTDGQTEVANQHIQKQLRPFVSYYQDDWSDWLPMINFAAAALPQESTKLSPFFIEHGFEPRTSFDWEPYEETMTPADRLSQQNTELMASRIRDIHDLARESMGKAQEQQAYQANKHRREVDFDTGDYVYMTMANWKTNRPSRKLENQQAGPYKILSKEGNSYRLDLPPLIKVYPVFSPDKL
jgi:hypothetical protein